MCRALLPQGRSMSPSDSEVLLGTGVCPRKRDPGDPGTKNTNKYDTLRRFMHTPCHLGGRHEVALLTPQRQVQLVNSTSLNPNQPGLIKYGIKHIPIRTSQNHAQVHPIYQRSVRILRCSSTNPQISWCGRRWTVSVEKPRCLSLKVVFNSAYGRSTSGC